MNFLKEISVSFLLVGVGVGSMFAQTFIESSQAVGIDHLHVDHQMMGGGTVFFDFDNDGFDDLYLTGGNGRDLLYKNNQDGTFTEVGISAGLSFTANVNTVGVATGDINNDGYRDVFITTDKYAANILLLNNGNATFSDISLGAGIIDTAWSTSATFGDYNQDGLLDIYVANYVDFADTAGVPFYENITAAQENYLYVNNGDSTFTEKAVLLGVNDVGAGLSARFTDFDNDGDMDIYVGNDFGTIFLPNRLYENLYPLDTFVDVANLAGVADVMYCMGVVVGDYNEDGWFDYFISNMMENKLHKNNGNKTFSNTANVSGVEAAAVTSWGSFFFDYNNDSYLDIFSATGQMMFNEPNQYQVNNLFSGSNGFVFADLATTEGLSDSTRSRGAAYSDFDNDGDLDFVIVNVNPDSNTTKRTWFMLNQSVNTGNWLKVNLVGTENNRDAFGTRVEVVAGGRRFVREIDGGSGYLSQNSSTAHFGLGAISQIDTLFIYWLGGAVQMDVNLAVNQTVNITENTSVHHYLCFGDSLQVGTAYYKESGTYYDTLVATGGGDSIINTVLHVSDSIYIQNLSICPNDSVEINGGYYTTPIVLQDTFPSFIAGCDSIVKYILTAGRKDTTFVDVYACQGDSVYLEGAYQTQSDYYVDTLLNDTYCDSLIVSHFMLYPVYTDTVTQYLCYGDSVFLNGAYQYAGGYYGDVQTTVNGCDSTVVTHLIEIPPFITVSQTLCQGDSVFLEGQYQHTSGVYYDTLTASSGCDSVVITQLSVVSNYSGTQFVDICQGDSIFLQGYYRTTPGIYNDTYTGVNGCDSSITTYLSVLPTYSTSQTISVCQGDSALINGNYETSAGIYSVTYAGVNGCDSTIETILEVLPTHLVQNDTTIYLGDSIYLQGAYQTQAGIYYDSLQNQYNCDSVIVTTLSIDSSVSVFENTGAEKMLLYPNPTNGRVYIKSKIKVQKVEVYNSIGEKQTEVYRKAGGYLEFSGLAKGVYRVVVRTEEGQFVSSLVFQ